MSLKGKLAVDKLAIGDEYAQVLYSFNCLKNNTAVRM